MYSTSSSVISYTYPSSVSTRIVSSSFLVTIAFSNSSFFLISSSYSSIYSLLLNCSITLSGFNPNPIVFNISSYSAFFASSFAFSPFFIIPFSPIKVAIDIIVNMIRTIMVITKAIKVIALSCFILLFIFICPFSYFFITLKSYALA